MGRRKGHVRNQLNQLYARCQCRIAISFVLLLTGMGSKYTQLFVLIWHLMIWFAPFLSCQALHIEFFLQRSQYTCGGGKYCGDKPQLWQDFNSGFEWPGVFKLHFWHANSIPRVCHLWRVDFHLWVTILLLCSIRETLQFSPRAVMAHNFFHVQLSSGEKSGWWTRGCLLVSWWTDVTHFISSTAALDCEPVPRQC